MKRGLTYLLSNGLSLVALCIGGWMAFKEKTGWGWFLFAAILFQVSYKSKEDEE